MKSGTVFHSLESVTGQIPDNINGDKNDYHGEKADCDHPGLPMFQPGYLHGVQRKKEENIKQKRLIQNPQDADQREQVWVVQPDYFVIDDIDRRGNDQNSNDIAEYAETSCPADIGCKKQHDHHCADRDYREIAGPCIVFEGRPDYVVHIHTAFRQSSVKDLRTLYHSKVQKDKIKISAYMNAETERRDDLVFFLSQH